MFAEKDVYENSRSEISNQAQNGVPKYTFGAFSPQ
jgi:hypothetical protein